MPTPRKKRAHGGTYFNPVYDLLESEGVEVAIWITDCMPCDRAINNRQIETIWLGTETDSEFYWNREIGFGEYIRVATC
jgi:predicted metal-dependent peptidase